MSVDRETNRIVRSWLQDGATRLPDRVLDLVLDELPTIHQRRATRWPVRRPMDMNKVLAFSVAAAAIVIVAILGIGILGPAGRGVGDDPPVATPSPEPPPLLEGSTGPGTFTTTPFGDNPPENPPQLTLHMPEGWSAVRPSFISTGEDSVSGTLFFLQPSGLYSDPCLDNSGAPDVSVGSTAEEFASALAGHTAYDASVTGETVIDGYDTIRMDLVTPSDLDYTTCENGEFWVWDAPLLSQTRNVWSIWIIDLNGATVVLLSDRTTTTAAQQDVVEQIVETVRIDR